LLGFDYRTLRNAIFLQGTGLDVAGSTFAKQMKLLESVLRFDDFTRATKVAAERAKALEILAREHITQLDSWSRQSEMARETIKELETLDETAREHELIGQIRARRAAIGEIDTSDRMIAVGAEKDAEDHLAQCKADLRHANEHVEAVNGIHLHGTDEARCYVCQSFLSLGQRDALLQSAVNAASACEIAVTQAEARLSRCSLALDVVNREVDRLRELQRALKNDERELEDIRTRASRRLGIIQAQSEKLVEAETNIVRLTDEIAATRRDILLAHTWSKRGFEDLKAEILGAAAPVLNEAADRYSNVLSDGALRVEFTTLRESRSENLLRIRRGHDMCAYESLSNGERRRVDLTIALALRSCARWRIAEPINLSVWDEVFDKLDESGMRRAVEVLQRDLSELETVFVITHSAAFKAMFGGANTIKVVRQHGVSRIE
jgi:DNA repair exonuclease SbcCD ATPase subunit